MRLHQSEGSLTLHDFAPIILSQTSFSLICIIGEESGGRKLSLGRIVSEGLRPDPIMSRLLKTSLRLTDKFQTCLNFFCRDVQCMGSHVMIQHLRQVDAEKQFILRSPQKTRCQAEVEVPLLIASGHKQRKTDWWNSGESMSVCSMSQLLPIMTGIWKTLAGEKLQRSLIYPVWQRSRACAPTLLTISGKIQQHPPTLHTWMTTTLIHLFAIPFWLDIGQG